MKKLFLIILALMPVFLFAQTRKEKRYAEKYDVLKYLPEKSDHNPATFWRAITQNNKEFQKNAKKFENPKGLAAQAYREVMNDAYLYRFQRLADRQPTEEDLEFCKTVCLFMLGDENSKMEFEIEVTQVPNAYCTPDGYVCIYTGIIDRLKGDINLISGIVAHEIAHYMYKHALIKRHKTLKKERENAIGAALHHVGESMLNLPDKEQRIQNIYANAERQTELYRFKYSRNEEVEADIVAYRFLDWIGVDPANMGNALKTIDPLGINREEKDDDDHPSTGFRIGVLSALKPAFYNK